MNEADDHRDQAVPTSHLARRRLIGGAAALAGASFAAGCATRAPAAFDPPALATLRSYLTGEVERGFAPGLVALVARRADVETFAIGTTSVGGSAPMRRDSIFRIASMSKPITAAAVMMLVEDGQLALDAPVERWLPELGNRRVLRRIDADLADTMPARRPILVEDLLTFRCGWGLVVAPPGRYPIQRAIDALKIVGFGPPDPSMPFDNDQWIARLGSLPLMAQPGETWLYTTGSDIQGVLVARATGRPLSRFLQERVFEPLGMKDTGFFVPPAKIDRLVTAYREERGTLIVSDPPAGQWSQPPAFEQGDGGLVSTVDDYLSFARLLLAGGRHRGRALLSPASVASMTRDHLMPAQRSGGAPILRNGLGWGYGMAVGVDGTPDLPSPGAFGWNGGFGTSWFSDPRRSATMILMTQRAFASSDDDALHRRFRIDAFAALG